MAEIKIDLDRGVQIRNSIHGIAVYMYYDDPGVYLNAHGDPVSEDLAREAGYDIARLAREKTRRDAVKKAMGEINEQFSYVGDDEVTKERNGYQIVKSGDFYTIRDPEGGILTKPMDALKTGLLFDKLVPKAEDE